MKDIRRGIWLITFGIIVFCAAQLMAEPPNAGDPKTDVKGCLCFFNHTNGKFYFNAFVKTADKESPGENGESEIWGFNVEPGNDIRDVHKITEDDKVVPVNAKKDIWIPADGKRHKIPIVPNPVKDLDWRWTTCPPYWNSATPIQSAEVR